MWNDLNMRDRHKLIKLAVTNGVYDLDTIHDLYDRKPNMYATGGETTIQPQIPTDPNRPIIDTQLTIDKIRTNNLAKYAMRDSTLQQIQDLTNRMYEEEIKRRTMEWLNPSNYTNKRDMVNALRVPVAEARPTFINTYEEGGPEDPPKYSYQWQDDSQKYVKPSNGTQGTSSEVFSFDNPMDPWNRFNYNQGNYIKSGIVTDAISLGLMAAPTIVPYITEGLTSPITTIASQIPQLGKYSYMLPTLDKALWTATGASGLYNRVSDEGIQGITSHPFLTAMDLGMLSPVAKGIKTVGNEAMWRYIPEIPISYIMRKNIKNTNLQKVIPQKPSGTNLMSRIKYIQELENGPSSLLIPKNKNNIIKFGDLEMNNPNLMYHVDNGNNTGFVGGITLKDNTLIPGTAKIEGQEPYIWWSKGSQYFNNNNRVITMPETKEFIRIRDSKIPIGQWNGKSGFVTNNEYVTPQIDISRGSVYTFDPDYGYVKLPTTEMPRTTNLLSQMSEYDRYKDFDFFHGGLDANFDFNTLDILRPGIKQSKKNYQYAGFYMNDLDHLAGSFRYGQGTAHGIKLKDNYKLIDLGEYNIEKMKTDELKKYIEQGYDILKGNNIWSQPEYILLNKNAILNTKFFGTPPIDYMEIPHRNPFLKQKRIKEIQNLTNNE